MRISHICAAAVLAATMFVAGEAAAFSFDQITPTQPDGSGSGVGTSTSAGLVGLDDQSIAGPYAGTGTNDGVTFSKKPSFLAPGLSFESSGPVTGGANRVWSTEQNPWK